MPRDIDPPLLDVVEGWTEMLGPFIILKDGVPLNLSAYSTPVIVLRKSSGTLITPGGVVTVDPDQLANTGHVYYKPIATDFVWESTLYTFHQPYQIHWKLTNVSGIVYSPSAGAAVIMVHRA